MKHIKLFEDFNNMNIGDAISGLGSGVKEGKIKKVIQYLVQGRDPEAKSFGGGKLYDALKKYINQIPVDKMQMLKKKTGLEIQDIFGGSTMKGLIEWLEKENIIK